MVTAVSSTTISLAWTPARDDRRVAGYGLYQDGEPIGTTAASEFVFFGLECGTGYAFLIEAFDDAGNRSQQVTLISATAASRETVRRPAIRIA